MSLLTELRHNFPVINVCSGSEADNPFYSRVIPRLLIQAKVSKRGLKQFINRQRSDGGGLRKFDTIRSQLAIAHNSPLTDALLILDDCFDHPSALDNDFLQGPIVVDEIGLLTACAYSTNMGDTFDVRFGVCNRVAVGRHASFSGGGPITTVRRGPEALGALHNVRHFPVPLPERTGS